MNRYEEFEEFLQTCEPNKRSIHIKKAMNETFGLNPFGKFASAHGQPTRTVIDKDNPKSIFFSHHFLKRMRERMGEEVVLPTIMGHKLAKGRCSLVRENRYVSHINFPKLGGKYSIIWKLTKAGNIVLVTLYPRLTTRDAMRMLKEAGAEGDTNGKNDIESNGRR